MGKCVNDKCGKETIDSPDRIYVTVDADCVCNVICKKEWGKQVGYFFKYIVHSEEKTKQYLLGKIDPWEQ